MAERLERGIDWMLGGHQLQTRGIFIALIKDFPEHIDAYHHLALSLEKERRRKMALNVWVEAMNLALKFFPEGFDFKTQRLPWDIMDNRPFLRALHGLCFALMKDGQFSGAIAMLERLLTLNPDDNVGARRILANCYFEMKMSDDVLKLCRQYSQDSMEQLIYGKALAWFQKGKHRKAGEALKIAIGFYPLIAAELLKEKHRKPRGMNEERIRAGGKDQAFLYWKEQGKHWRETLGAVEWLREMVKREG